MKKITCLLLALFLFASVFTACSPSEYVGVDSSGLDPFVIGGIGPLTEDGATYGLSVKNGAQLAVDEINATGGVNGFRLVLNFQDSTGDPAGAETVYAKLKSNNMKVLLGGVLNEEAAALATLAAEDGMLTVTPTASGNEVLGTGGNVFRICQDNRRLGITAANLVADRKMGSRVLTVSTATSFGGRELMDSFVQTCKERGVEGESILLMENFDEDVINQLLSPLAEKPFDLLFLLLSESDAELFFREYTHLFPQSDPTLLMIPPALPEKKATAGKEMTSSEGQENYDQSHTLMPSQSLLLREGTCILSSFFSNEDSPLVQNFVTSYKSAYGVTPDRYAADAYDGIYAIAEAIKKAGITPENADYGDTSQKLISAMTRIEVRGVTGTMSWTPDGETSRPASARILRDGEYLPLTKATDK